MYIIYIILGIYAGWTCLSLACTFVDMSMDANRKRLEALGSNLNDQKSPTPIDDHEREICGHRMEVLDELVRETNLLQNPIFAKVFKREHDRWCKAFGLTPMPRINAKT